MTKLKQGQKVAAIATVITFFLALAKAIVGFLSGSIALITDAVHSTADIFTIFGAWLGLKIADRKPDQRFPYGYYKAENLATFFISIMILYLAYNLLISGYSQLFKIPDISFTSIALAIPLISAIISFIISIDEKKKGQEINSQALIANGEESLLDTFSSLIVFIAIASTHFGLPYADGIVAIIISLLVLKIGVFNIKDALLSLMDISPAKEIEKKAEKALGNISGLKDFEDLKLRKSGPFIFGEVTAKIRKDVDVKRAHEIADTIEKTIKTNVPSIESLTVHVEPYQLKKQKICIPIEKKKGLKSKISDKFGRAKYFMFVLMDKEKIKETYIKKNPYTKKDIRAGLKASNFIVQEKIDALITKEIGEISFHTLRDHLVDIYTGKQKTIQGLVNALSKKKLKRLKKPTLKRE